MNYPRWIPFIGFRTLPIDNDGRPSPFEYAPWASSCLMIEWFGQGIILFSTGVKENTGEVYKRGA